MFGVKKEKNILIEIDGTDFSSKTTLITALKGNDVFNNWNFCRLPGTSKLGEILRPVVKEMELKPNTSLGVALAGMSSAYYDMAEMNTNIITDRGLSSVIMYQFNLDGAYKDNPVLAEAVFNSLRRQVENSFDYYRVILTATPETIKARKAARGVEAADRFDNIDEEGIKNNVEGYKAIIRDGAHFNILKTYYIPTDELTVEEEVEAFLSIIDDINKRRNGEE